MHQRFIPLAVAALLLSASAVHAQCNCGASPVYAPAAPAPSYSTYYAPAAVDYTPAPYVSYYAAPAAPVSYVSYYAPPAAYAAPVSYVSYYAPATPYATYYAPPAVAVPYRAYYYGVPGWSVYGTPRVYVPGEPVRNTLRAVTP